MPTYFAPGVYVEEVPPVARPIAGVGTSTAAFVGEADRLAPRNLRKPTKFTSWKEFSEFIKGGSGFHTDVSGFPQDGAATSATSNAPVFTSSSYSFVAEDVGHYLYIKSGTNWTPGFYQIMSVGPGSATLDRPCSSVAAPTGATFGVDYSRGNAPRFKYTDLVIGTTTTQFTSASNPVDENIVGNTIQIVSGNGFVLQNVVVASTNGTTATVDKSLGTASSTAGGGSLGFASAPDTTPIFTTVNRTLALAVFGFFNNGGTACYVLPVAAGDMATLATLLETLEAIDEIAIVAAPGVEDIARKGELLDHCFKMEDRVAVLDGVKAPASDSTPADIFGGPMPGGGPTTPDKFSYGAVYFPWLKVNNPLFTNGGAEPKLVDQPPSGHIAGIWARVDATRGVHKAPANEGVVGIVDLERTISRDKQKSLNPTGINVIRPFGSAPMVYGARTLGGDRNGEYRYLNVRRFMNFLKESIDEGTQFVVFEPNNPALWQRIIQSVSAFLFIQWQDGALFGETAKQAFFVKCDAETNPAATREAGQVITEIGVAVTKPAEFVIFRIQQNTGS